ncbi:MAG: DNRLRE domain-containing protein, partial [Anaerolineae bacterium]|nr:DNRLRE domain-containing protein [Anaerolineae bacterium]
MNMPARGMERQRNRRWAGLLVLLLLVGMLCLAGTLFFERLTGAGQARFVPVQLHSALAANYRIDFAPPRLPPVRPEIIWDAILDNEGIAISAARKAGLLDVFQLPVPFVASPVCQGRHVIEAGRDTWLDSASPATVYGRDTVLQLGRQGNQLKRILLYFPLDESLRGASIYRASLELRVAGGPGIDTPELRLANLAAPFNETATNWSNQPDPFLNYRSLPLVIAESHTWDVTDMAQAWLLDRYPNHGLMLEPQSAKDFTIFYYSREAGQQTGGGPNPANGVSPRLIIDCSGPTPEPEAVVAAP